MDALAWSLVAAISCYVWRMQDLYPILGSVRIPILSSLAVIGFYFVDGDRRRALTTTCTPITKCVLIILALAIAGVPTSLYQGASFRFIIDDFSKNVLLFVILLASVRCFEDVRRYAAALVIGGFIYAQYVYLNVSIGEGGRLGNIAYYDANDLGMLLVCTLPLALFFLMRGRLLVIRGAAAAALALFVLIIVRTGSRGAFLGMVAIGLYLLFFLNAVSRTVRIAAVTASVAALLFFSGDQYWDMMATILNPKDDYNWSGQSDSGRMEVWKRGLGYMMQHPVTGVGARAFGTAEGTISNIASRQEYGIGVKWSVAHNSFVEIGAELGIGGLIVFMVLLVTAYRTARRSKGATMPRRRSDDDELLGQVLAGSVVGYVVAGFFLSQAYAAYAMTIYALIAGLDYTRYGTRPRALGLASQRGAINQSPRGTARPRERASDRG